MSLALTMTTLSEVSLNILFPSIQILKVQYYWWATSGQIALIFLIWAGYTYILSIKIEFLKYHISNI